MPTLRLITSKAAENRFFVKKQRSKTPLNSFSMEVRCHDPQENTPIGRESIRIDSVSAGA